MIPEGKSPEEGNGNPLQYSCLENSMDRGTWWASAHGVAKELNTTQQLSRDAPLMHCMPLRYNQQAVAQPLLFQLFITVFGMNECSNNTDAVNIYNSQNKQVTLQRLNLRRVGELGTIFPCCLPSHNLHDKEGCS